MTGTVTARPAAPAPTAAAPMRAAVLTGAGRFVSATTERPQPAPGDVRVRLEGCGVCASSLPLWEGREWFTYPQTAGAPGHEGWGVIDALGEDVTSLRAGDRVALVSYHAFAEYDVARADAVVPLPGELATHPVPGEPLGCAMNVFARSDVRAGDDVAIVGIGFLGAILTRLAADAGARVIAISRRPFALELARAFGAHEVVPMDDHARIIERVKHLTAGRLCARVIECVGLQWPLDLATELASERGRLVIAGYHQDGSRQVNMWLWNWRGLDVINAHERDPQAYVRGMREGIAAVHDGRLDLAPLLTHRYALDELDAAFRATRDRPDGFVKAVVDLR